MYMRFRQNAPLEQLINIYYRFYINYSGFFSAFNINCGPESLSYFGNGAHFSNLKFLLKIKGIIVLYRNI